MNRLRMEKVLLRWRGYVLVVVEYRKAVEGRIRVEGWRAWEVLRKEEEERGREKEEEIEEGGAGCEEEGKAEIVETGRRGVKDGLVEKK